ncbi:MAG TPA: type II secretion system protein [Desulfobulbaceae bacterium]|nr:type II secretion system protein [Desulfobulbaceae bacterium]
MKNPALLLSLSTFVVVIVLFWAISALLASRRKEQNVLKRAVKWSGSTQHPGLPTLPMQDLKESGRFFVSFFPKTSKQDSGTSYYADTPLFYQRAGIYDPKLVRSYQTLRIVLFIMPIIGLIASRLLYHLSIDGIVLLVTLLIICIVYYLPILWLRVVAHYRKKDLYRNFPDAIDLLMVCVEAGLGVDAAIRRVSKEISITSPELAKEFKILSLELKTGKSRNACLKNLALRTDLADIDNLVSLMIQAEKYGTGVANALRIHSEEMRQRRYATLEELASKLPVKLTAPLIFFIFPAFFVVIAGPAAIQVFRVILER